MPEEQPKKPTEQPKAEMSPEVDPTRSANSLRTMIIQTDGKNVNVTLCEFTELEVSEIFRRILAGLVGRG